MKVKVNWKELGKQLWAAVKPVLLAAIGISTGRRPQLLLALASCGIVTVAAGCSSLTPSSKVQSMGVYAFGLPAIAVITQSGQTADYSGGDTNGVSQANPVTTIVPISAK